MTGAPHAGRQQRLRHRRQQPGPGGRLGGEHRARPDLRRRPRSCSSGPSSGSLERPEPRSSSAPRRYLRRATAINDRGQVVGISGTCDQAVGRFTAAHAVIWEEGGVRDIGDLGGAPGTRRRPSITGATSSGSPACRAAIPTDPNAARVPLDPARRHPRTSARCRETSPARPRASTNGARWSAVVRRRQQPRLPLGRRRHDGPQHARRGPARRLSSTPRTSTPVGRSTGGLRARALAAKRSRSS